MVWGVLGNAAWTLLVALYGLVAGLLSSLHWAPAGTSIGTALADVLRAWFSHEMSGSSWLILALVAFGTLPLQFGLAAVQVRIGRSRPHHNVVAGLIAYGIGFLTTLYLVTLTYNLFAGHPLLTPVT